MEGRHYSQPGSGPPISEPPQRRTPSASTIYDPASGTAGLLIDAVDHILARNSEKPLEVPIYGEDWLEKRGQTLDEAQEDIPNLQTYRKGPASASPTGDGSRRRSTAPTSRAR